MCDWFSIRICMEIGMGWMHWIDALDGYVALLFVRRMLQPFLKLWTIKLYEFSVRGSLFCPQTCLSFAKPLTWNNQTK